LIGNATLHHESFISFTAGIIASITAHRQQQSSRPPLQRTPVWSACSAVSSDTSTDMIPISFPNSDVFIALASYRSPLKLSCASSKSNSPRSRSPGSGFWV
jgi:hypothetical protein